MFQQHLAANYQEMGENEKAIAIYQEWQSPIPKSIRSLRMPIGSTGSSTKPSPWENNSTKRIRATFIRRSFTLELWQMPAKPRKALKFYPGCCNPIPMNIDIYVNLSQVYLQDKRYADAEKILLRAEEKKLENESDKERLKFQRATVYEKQKDFDRAESLFKEILKTNPNNAVALNYIGYMLADRGVRLEEALQYVKEALAIDPHNGAYLDSLGWAFFKLNDLENAEKYLLQADELVKNDPTIDDHLGDLYFKTGDFQKAQRLLEEIRQHRNGTGRHPEGASKTGNASGNASQTKIGKVTTSPLRARSFAKINLALSVLGRRTDGYHDIQTVFQSIDLVR